MDWLAYVIIPILIFIARIIDVSLGTLRIIFAARGYKRIAPILGFFEILVWLLAIQQIFVNLTNVICYLAYAGGYAAGTYIGIRLEEKLSMGKVIVRVITKTKANQLLRAFKRANYTVTSVEATGKQGKVHVIYVNVKRKSIPRIMEIINKHNPNAFYSVEDVRFAHEERILPSSHPHPHRFNTKKGK